MHTDNLKGKVQNQHKQLLDELGKKQAHLIEEHNRKRAEKIAKLNEERKVFLETLQREEITEKHKLQKRQDKMFENIDKAEQDLDKKSEKINQNDTSKLQLVVSKSNNIETTVIKIKQSIDEKPKKIEKCGLFVALKKAKHNLKHLRIVTERLAEDIDVSFYEFKPSNDKINLETSDYKIPFSKFRDKSEVERTIGYECSINAKSEKDKTRSHLTGICKYSDFLVVADKGNKAIKLVNTKENSLSSFLQLQAEPFDVTCVERDEVAATLPESRKIQFFSITEEGVLSMNNEIDVRNPCYGTEYKKPNLIVAFPTEVQILSTTGVSIWKFTDISTTRYIHLDCSNKTFYIDGPHVQRVTFDGQIVKRSCYMTCSGLDVDHYGSVFAKVSRGTYFQPETDVIQLSAYLEVIQKIDIRQYTDKASCLCYCIKEHKLYVATFADTILVFKLT